MKIGMQVIIEDCVDDNRAKYAPLLANALFAIAAMFSSVDAVLQRSFGV
jgi:succinate dehydrogenase hydrophobic anchor subunit